MTEAELKKLKTKKTNLTDCKKKINKKPNRKQTRTDEVRNAKNDIVKSLEGFIKSDNVSAYYAVPTDLAVKIEDHSDFEEAAKALDRSISQTQKKIEEAEAAKQTPKPEDIFDSIWRNF